MLLKINNIRDLSDARYAAAALAEWIGFKVGGEDDLSAAAIQEIIGWCAGPKIVLEVEPGTSEDRISSLLDVLPVDSLECDEADLERLQSAFTERNLEWMLRGDAPKPGTILHTDQLTGAENTICRIVPGSISPQQIEAASPYAISLDCYPSESTGIKDFTAWNDLLEGLNIL